MAESLAQLKKDLAAWEDTLARREKDEARRVVQAQHARARAVQARGGPDAGKNATLYQRAKDRLNGTRRAVQTARDAITRKSAQVKKASQPTGRAAALGWCKRHLYITEQPPGSNRDNRKDGITAWQRKLAGGAGWLVGTAWCGTFCANALMAAKVKGVTSRLASVALIEDDARAGKGPFVSWSTNASSASPGDLVVLFGRGVHVEIVRAVSPGVLHTYGGNTSSGTGGSQSNGGGSFPRDRAFSSVHGIAHVRY